MQRKNGIVGELYWACFSSLECQLLMALWIMSVTAMSQVKLIVKDETQISVLLSSMTILLWSASIPGKKTELVPANLHSTSYSCK